MSKVKKLANRLITRPKDFTWDELKTLLQLEFKEIQGSGSRVKFFHPDKNCLIQLHRPHPQKILKPYIIREVLETLKNEQLI